MFHYCPWLILSKTNKNNVVPDVQCQAQPRPWKLLDWNIVKGNIFVAFSYHLFHSIPFPSFYWSSGRRPTM
jgi:disulfide bond formation protein DsbB